MSDIDWDKIPEKKRNAITAKLRSTAGRMLAVDYSNPAHTRLITKIKFYAIRMMQTQLGRKDPEYTDFKYWKENGWTGSVRPWK